MLVDFTKKLGNKVKELSGNSNYTVRIIDDGGITLIPQKSQKNELVDGLFHPNGPLAYQNSEIEKWLEQQDFANKDYLDTFFSFDIGPGIPKNYMPWGVVLMGYKISLYHWFSGSFSGPQSSLWSQIIPDTNAKMNYEPTQLFRLLSELGERKICLEFPARVFRKPFAIYGALPSVGNLRFDLRSKKVI